jgi:hypothetical protein
MTTQLATLEQTVMELAPVAGLTVLESPRNPQSAAEETRSTALFRFGLSPETTFDRSLTLELTGDFQASDSRLRPGLLSWMQAAAVRLRNPRPDAAVTLAGLPIAFTGFEWPFHRSTSGADTLIVHGLARLEDGAASPLHAKIAASVTVTFAEIMAAPEQPYAEDFIYNAVRKTLDQGQLELLKSGNRQPVPVTTRYFSRWQNRFLFSDTNEDARAEFVALKVYWLSDVLGGGQPVWIADPRDAQYLNTTPAELEAAAARQAKAGLVELAAGFARPTEKLHELGEHYRSQMLQALSLTKPAFNEEMRAGHTNM